MTNRNEPRSVFPFTETYTVKQLLGKTQSGARDLVASALFKVLLNVNKAMVHVHHPQRWAVEMWDRYLLDFSVDRINQSINQPT